MSKASRAMKPPGHYTFRKTITHTADSKDQRHAVPVGRGVSPILARPHSCRRADYLLSAGDERKNPSRDVVAKPAD